MKGTNVAFTVQRSKTRILLRFAFLRERGLFFFVGETSQNSRAMLSIAKVSPGRH